MKKIFLLSLLSLIMLSSQSKAQEKSEPEKYGKTLNLGLGLGYYSYTGSVMPVLHANFEFDVFKNFTLAPFISLYTYQNQYYWGDPNRPNWDQSYRYYNYREVAVPVGIKGSYYFDQLLHASSKWDFYAGASLGFVYRSITWENGYYGDARAYQNASPLYMDLHAGAEYHMTPKAGLFLDLSTGVSTFGLAIHF